MIPFLTGAVANPGYTKPWDASHAAQKYTDGYTILEANGYTLILGGRIKADAFYDINDHQPGTPFGLDVANIPLRGTPIVDINAYKKGNFNYSMNSSRLYMDTHKKFGATDVRGYLELDFNGNASTTSNSYTPRLRHAYVESCGLLIGQTWFTFSDRDALIFTLDSLASTTGRVVTVRYMVKLNKEWSFMISADRPNTQLYQFAVNSNAGTTVSGNTGYFDNDSSSAAAKSQCPDGAAVLKYEHKGSHVSLRGVLRDLQVKNRIGANGSVESYKENKLGWGIGVSGKFKVMDCFKIMGQYNHGHGIGRYISEFLNQKPLSSVFVYPTSTAALTAGYKSHLQAIKAWNASIGIEIHFTDKIWANATAAYVKISRAKNLLALHTPDLHRSFQRYIGNIIYDVLPNTRVGLEVLHYNRKSGTPINYTGKDTRVLTSLSYMI